MLNLPNVTLVAVTTRDYAQTIGAISKSLEQITPAEVLFFTDVPFPGDDYQNILIPRFDSWEGYNHFLVKKLNAYIKTSHVLVIQWDGYVLDASAWTDEYLQYDYIGAPWTYRDGRNVGNGGFSLRSKRLHDVLASDPFIEECSPEDEIIGRLYRRYLENKHQIKFAPESMAHKFSFEQCRPWQKTFGFHNFFNEPYREPIILKRSFAMGDVLMMEPLMEHLHNAGYMVVLDCPNEYMGLFERHFYPVYHVNHFDTTKGLRTINLDMAYEVKPKQLVLKSYFEFAGIKDYTLRNPRLNFPVDETTKMFDRYVVLHIDDTAMAHRNAHLTDGDWNTVIKFLEDEGYKVFVVGNGQKKYGTFFNTRTKNMLMYLLAGADFFIGIDSGPAQMAVAVGTKAIILFGSVNPAYRYADMTNIRAIQNPCPIGKDGCYHSVVSIRGVQCEVNKESPPCITHSTDSLIQKIIDNIYGILHPTSGS